MLTGGAPGWVYEYVRSPKLIPLEKKAGELDPRPVGCADVLWRWASRALMFSQKEAVARHVAPHQFAVGQRAGAEAMGHGVEVDVGEMPDACWLGGDVLNAFNTVDRASMLEAAAEASPQLAVAALAMYDGQTRYRYQGERATFEMPTDTGCVQGDPLSMALFCLAIRAPVSWVTKVANAAVTGGRVEGWAEPAPSEQAQAKIAQWLERARCVAPPRDSKAFQSVTVKPRFYADDGVWRVPRWLVGFLPSLIQTCFAEVGLAMKASKWEAWTLGGQGGGLEPGEAGPMVAVRAPSEGIVVAGAPISDVASMPAAAVVVGSGQFAAEYLAKVVRRAEVMCEAVARVPEVAAAAYPSRKIALRLVVDCV